jgi:ABC-type sulfate/molybdate transport systems ATPase subunit
MVLAGLDLRVGEGELYGLIGPNGAGKTTALRVALGLLQADAGQVRLPAWPAAWPCTRAARSATDRRFGSYHGRADPPEEVAPRGGRAARLP